jgi:hypothetical protein
MHSAGKIYSTAPGTLPCSEKKISFPESFERREKEAGGRRKMDQREQKGGKKEKIKEQQHTSFTSSTRMIRRTSVRRFLIPYSGSTVSRVTRHSNIPDSSIGVRVRRMCSRRFKEDAATVDSSIVVLTRVRRSREKKVESTREVKK